MVALQMFEDSWIPQEAEAEMDDGVKEVLCFCCCFSE